MATVRECSDGRGPLVLLAATLYWPLSARLAVRFLEYGCRVVAICPKGHYLRCIEGIETHFSYRALSPLGCLERTIREVRPEIVIPCDDRAVWQLHELHRAHHDLRAIIEESLGSPTNFDLIEHRAPLLETARSIGIRVPRTCPITSEEDLDTWFAECGSVSVLKLDGTWAGEGVSIVHSAQEAKTTFRRLSRPTGLMTSCKRLAVDRDPLALWSWSIKKRPSMIIQQWIEGQPANSMLACWKGELLASASVEVLASAGVTGAAFLVRLMEDERLLADARALARQLELSGLFGFDYVIDKVTRVPFLIEANPRCTQLGHLPLAGGYDLAGALYSKLTGRICETHRQSVQGRVVAFFPQAECLAGRCSFPSHVYKDIPQNQPRLMTALTQPMWPERQWLSRVYHTFYPLQKIEPKEFDCNANLLAASLSKCE